MLNTCYHPRRLVSFFWFSAVDIHIQCNVVTGRGAIKGLVRVQGSGYEKSAGWCISACQVSIADEIDLAKVEPLYAGAHRMEPEGLSSDDSILDSSSST